MTGDYQQELDREYGKAVVEASHFNVVSRRQDSEKVENRGFAQSLFLDDCVICVAERESVSVKKREVDPQKVYRQLPVQSFT